LPESFKIAGQTYASPSEYNDLRNGCMELLRRYPPDQYYFVGLGRDPAPVIAFLQNLGEKDLAVNLPGTSNIAWQGRVAAEDVARHIEAAIPEKVLAGDRTIVLLDVTSSGKTPAVFGPFFDRYMESRGRTDPSVRLAFSWKDVRRGQWAKELTDWIDTTAWADFRRYYTGKYEGNWQPGREGMLAGMGIAEHQKHMMGPGVEPPTVTNPNYAAFRAAVRARMEQDRELDTFLAKLSGVAEAGPAAEPPAAKPRPAWTPSFEIAFDGSKAMPDRTLLTLSNTVNPPRGDDATDRARSFSYLNASEYAQLRDGALALMQQAPPERSFYVGVGRTAGPLTAFFENLGRDAVAQLPADGIQRLAKGKGDPSAPQVLEALFDAYLPKEALDGSRSIVLFQRSDSGVSLPYLRNALAAYLQRKGSGATVDVIAFSESRPAEGRHIDVSQLPELQLLNADKYKQVAPYPFFRPGSDDRSTVVTANGTPATPRDEYVQFKSALKQRMVSDKALQASLGDRQR
jgi:hypothetical protein